jgi:PhzF family phenazine biosynthesis protein
VRIFTPAYEMPFAGHPTLGSAHVCRALGLGGDRLTLEMTAGIIPVHALGDRWTLQAKAPAWREVAEGRLALAALLGLEEHDIGEHPLWVNAGREQLIVPLTSEAAVRRVRVRADLLEQFHSTDGHSQVYVFAPLGAGLLARFFFPKGAAVLEDPATGSATANLGGWCLATGRRLPCEFDISQGEYTGRPSALRLRVDAQRQVLVSGEVVELGRGTISL